MDSYQLQPQALRHSASNIIVNFEGVHEGKGI